MEQNFLKAPAAVSLWKAMRTTGDVYRTCIDLKYCEPDPEGEWSVCHHALWDDPACELEAKCKATESCTSSCYTCNRLIREWPIFMEACQPPGTNINDEVEGGNPAPIVPSANSILPISFTETASASAALSPEDRAFIEAAAQGRAAFDEVNAERARRIQQAIQSGAIAPQQLQQIAEFAAAGALTAIEPDLPPVFLELRTTVLAHAAGKPGDPNHAMDNGPAPPPKEYRAGVDRDLIESTCFGKYKELAQSRRARYFMSYKQITMPALNPDDVSQALGWDAHSVCKCLKAGCGMQPAEGLGMISTCQYSPMHELIMKMAFPGLANP